MADLHQLEPIDEDPFGSDILTNPVVHYVLDHIASGEAKTYDEIFGGHKIKSLEQHPRIEVPIPGTDKFSSAAGRYQFEKGTWADEAKRLDLNDFSPRSQDLAAWDLADRTYSDKTGRSLLDDASQGSVAWSALASQWPSLVTNRPLRAETRPQTNSLMPQQQQRPIASLMHPISPNGESQSKGLLDPLSLLSHIAPHLSFTPVDGDPFQSQSHMEQPPPVEGPQE